MAPEPIGGTGTSSKSVDWPVSVERKVASPVTLKLRRRWSRRQRPRVVDFEEMDFEEITSRGSISERAQVVDLSGAERSGSKGLEDLFRVGS